MGRNNKQNQDNDSMDIYIAKLAYIGTAISTLGDGIQTIAAGLALESLQNAKNNGDQTAKVDACRCKSII